MLWTFYDWDCEKFKLSSVSLSTHLKKKTILFKSQTIEVPLANQIIFILMKLLILESIIQKKNCKNGNYSDVKLFRHFKKSFKNYDHSILSQKLSIFVLSFIYLTLYYIAVCCFLISVLFTILVNSYNQSFMEYKINILSESNQKNKIQNVTLFSITYQKLFCAHCRLFHFIQGHLISY